MLRRIALAAGFACLACSAPAWADPIASQVSDMIKAAADTGDAATLKTTADLAKKTNPQSVAEIDALVAGLQKTAEDKRIATIKDRGFLQGWKGQGQAGGSVTTGNTKSTGIALGLALNKEGIHWRHAITGTVDYSRENGPPRRIATSPAMRRTTSSTIVFMPSVWVAGSMIVFPASADGSARRWVSVIRSSRHLI